MAMKKIEEFQIINRRTGKALQAAGTENGQCVVQAAPEGGDAQLWTLVGQKLINKESGKALDVVHGGVENGTWAHVWDSVEDAPSQSWEVVKVTATYKKLRNVQSGKVLDIVDMSEEDAPSKTVTRTAKKESEAAAPAAKNPRARKVAEAVKETAATVKEVVKETVAKPAAKKEAAKEAPAKKAPAKGKK